MERRVEDGFRHLLRRVVSAPDAAMQEAEVARLIEEAHARAARDDLSLTAALVAVYENTRDASRVSAPGGDDVSRIAPGFWG